MQKAKAGSTPKTTKTYREDLLESFDVIYQHGWNAREKGEVLSENYYQSDTFGARVWEAGWKDAPISTDVQISILVRTIEECEEYFRNTAQEPKADLMRRRLSEAKIKSSK